MFWITLEQIQCFQEVVAAGSFTQAAHRLNKAKSAVMYSVKGLEDQLGFELLDRSNYRPKPTARGESFLLSSKKVMSEMKELYEKTSLIASEIETRLKISASGIFDSNQLYPVLKKTMNRFPLTEVLFEKEILSGEKMLSRGLVDLAIFENLKNKKDFEYKVISKVHLKLVISSHHEFIKQEKKKQLKSDLYKYPQIVQRSTIADEDFSVGVHEESLKWKVTDTPSKKEIILNGLGWGRLPLHTVEKEIKSGKLIHLANFKDDDKVDVYLCRKKEKPMGKVAQFIWDCF